MTPMRAGFQPPRLAAVGLEGNRSRCICYHGRPHGDSFEFLCGNRKPRLSNSDEDSGDDVDYDRTPVGKINVVPTRSVPTRVA